MEKDLDPIPFKARAQNAANEMASTMNSIKETAHMLRAWAEKQAGVIITQMELKRDKHTLDIHWHRVKRGWTGGFVSGVQAGFQMGMKTQEKLTANFLSTAQATAIGNEEEIIKAHNAELKSFLSEMVGEASMCWTNPENAGVFDSTRANQVVDKLFERFGTPIPEKPKAVDSQERLPGL